MVIKESNLKMFQHCLYNCWLYAENFSAVDIRLQKLKIADLEIGNSELKEYIYFSYNYNKDINPDAEIDCAYVNFDQLKTRWEHKLFLDSLIIDKNSYLSIIPADISKSCIQPYL